MLNSHRAVRRLMSTTNILIREQACLLGSVRDEMMSRVSAMAEVFVREVGAGHKTQIAVFYLLRGLIRPAIFRRYIG
jgi:hypothetical protein